MLVYQNFKELKAFIHLKKLEGKTIGFVPTMGALHSGHLSLIALSKNQNDFTICSIFVNPTQFNNPNDLATYPRTEEQDLEMLSNVGCEVAFVPMVEEIYPADYVSPTVDLKGLDLVMEGAHRPGHFDGVVQVVNRLFEQIAPHKAYFGKKDFQQLAVIKQMVKETNSPVEIIGCPIKRAESGLALSSRNVRLSPEGLKEAAKIYEALLYAKSRYAFNELTQVEAEVMEKISQIKGAELEYFEIADEHTLLPPVSSKCKVRGFIVVVIEGVRLIDNLGLN